MACSIPSPCTRVSIALTSSVAATASTARPTIIINGKYRTDVGMAGGYDQLFELIEALAAAELGL